MSAGAADFFGCRMAFFMSSFPFQEVGLFVSFFFCNEPSLALGSCYVWMEGFPPFVSSGFIEFSRF
jgi:hypothetical protein